MLQFFKLSIYDLSKCVETKLPSYSTQPLIVSRHDQMRVCWDRVSMIQWRHAEWIWSNEDILREHDLMRTYQMNMIQQDWRTCLVYLRIVCFSLSSIVKHFEFLKVLYKFPITVIITEILAFSYNYLMLLRPWNKVKETQNGISGIRSASTGRVWHQFHLQFSAMDSSRIKTYTFIQIKPSSKLYFEIYISQYWNLFHRIL